MAYETHFAAWQAAGKIRTAEEAQQWLADVEPLRTMLTNQSDLNLFRTAHYNVTTRLNATLAKRKDERKARAIRAGLYWIGTEVSPNWEADLAALEAASQREAA